MCHKSEYYQKKDWEVYFTPMAKDPRKIPSENKVENGESVKTCCNMKL